eukprot:3782062-Amphidinium_carterae.1
MDCSFLRMFMAPYGFDNRYEAPLPAAPAEWRLVPAIPSEFTPEESTAAPNAPKRSTSRLHSTFGVCL